MFTTTVGRTFLNEYNRRKNKNLSAKEFFDQELFPLFFDHPKYLMWAKDSPFVQQVSTSNSGALGLRDRIKDENGNTLYFDSEESLKQAVNDVSKNEDILEYKIEKRSGKNQSYIKILKALSKDIRKSKLEELDAKLREGRRDSSVAIGFPALDKEKFATTSGLVTDLVLDSGIEDAYLSWIGGAMIIGVADGLSLLFNDPEITWSTYIGWKVYGRYLNDETLEKLRPNQVTTWNGQWLTYYFGKDYQEDFDFRTLENEGIFSVGSDQIEINTIEWSRLFFSLSQQFPDAIKIGYVTNFGKTNTTIGFFPFHFKRGQTLVKTYQKLFGVENYEVNKNDFEKLFGKHIKRACELGAIGLQALEPKNLSKYFADKANLNLAQPNLSRKNNESEDEYVKRREKLQQKDRDNLITFQTYKTWLIAMIAKNKEEISEYTQDVAEALVKYRAGAKKMDRKNLLEKKLFASKRKNDFLEALIEIVNDDRVEEDIVVTMKELRDKVHFMSNEDFVYFVLLLKFDYAYQERMNVSTNK